MRDEKTNKRAVIITEALRKMLWKSILKFLLLSNVK